MMMTTTNEGSGAAGERTHLAGGSARPAAEGAVVS